jgi:hypothetical protein
MATDNKTQVVITAKDETAAGLSSVAASVGKLAGSFTGLANPVALAGTAVTAVTAAMVASIKSAVNTGDQLNKLSQKTGIAVESLSALAYAGELADVPIEALANGIRKLSVNMAEAAANTKGEAAGAFAALGIAATDTEGKLRGSDAVLGDIADRFAAMKDGAGKTALAVQLFGKAGAELIPLLNQGSKGIEELRVEAEKLGLVMSGKTAKDAEEFNDNIKKLSLSVSALGRSIAADLIGPLAEMTRLMVEARKNGAGLVSMLTLGVQASGADQKSLDELKDRAAVLQDRIRIGAKIDPNFRSAAMKEMRAEMLIVQRQIQERLAQAQEVIPPFAAGGLGEAPIVDARAKKTGKTDLEKMLELGQKNLAASFSTDESLISVSTAAAIYAKAEEDAIEKRRIAMEKMAEQRMEEVRIATEGEEAIRLAMDRTTSAIEKQGDIASDLGMTFASAFEDAAIGGKKFSEVLKGLAQDVGRIILRKTVTEPLAKSVGGLLDGLFKDLNFGGGRAMGGAVNPGSYYVVGENGPELLLPGTSGTVVPASAGMGGGVTVNIIGAPSQPRVQQRSDGSGGLTLDVIFEQVDNFIAGGIASGRGATADAMGSTYGLNRAAGAF